MAQLTEEQFESGFLESVFRYVPGSKCAGFCCQQCGEWYTLRTAVSPNEEGPYEVLNDCHCGQRVSPLKGFTP